MNFTTNSACPNRFLGVALLGLIVPLIVAPATPVRAAERPNVLLICIDDLRPELACFGKHYIHSPHIDELAARGTRFVRHYVQSPTCGASRYTLLTGRYGSSSNNALFDRAKTMGPQAESIPPSMPAWFRQHGYRTVSVGKVSHHPGGRGGKDWDDEKSPEMPNSWDRHLIPTGAWQHPRGWMHGLANGEIRTDAGKMDVYQSVAGDDEIYPDGISINESLQQLKLLTAEGEPPFFLAVGILRPHLPFGAPAQYIQHYDQATLPPIPHPTKPDWKTTWHASGEFMKYNRWGRNPNSDPEFATLVRKHYAACVTYADAQVGRVMQALAENGADKNTIVVLWGDHGWQLGEHAIWGKHCLFEESLRSPLIVSYPGQEQVGEAAEGIVETVDVFPTLCDLAGVPEPEFAQGRSLRPALFDPKVEGQNAVSYRSKGRTIRTPTHRLIDHGNGYIELYDQRPSAEEFVNLAESERDLVQSLVAQLDERLPRPASAAPQSSDPATSDGKRKKAGGKAARGGRVGDQEAKDKKAAKRDRPDK